MIQMLAAIILPPEQPFFEQLLRPYCTENIRDNQKYKLDCCTSLQNKYPPFAHPLSYSQILESDTLFYLSFRP